MKNIYRITVKPKSLDHCRYFSYLVLADTLEEALGATNQFDEFDILSTHLVSDRMITKTIYREL